MGIVYLNLLWFVGWSARLLLYTPTDSGSLGGQPGSYCIPQPTLVRWVVSQAPIVYPNRPWFVGWSARFLLYTPTDPGSLGGHPGSYCIPQPTLVRWVVSQVPIVYPNRLWFVGWSALYLQQVCRNMTVIIYITIFRKRYKSRTAVNIEKQKTTCTIFLDYL